MVAWLIFILAIILGHYLLDTLVALLNLKALSPRVPDEFSDTYDPREYVKSQEYTRARTRLSLVENTCTTLATLAFLLFGGFNVIDQIARSFHFGPVVTGLIFTAILLFLSALVGLPFRIYSTFSLEARFGFNRTTASTFVTDVIKTVLLTIVLGTPLLALILWFFQSTGATAWVYCWLGVVVFGIAMQFVAPVLIMPLFNTFTELEDGPLRDKIIAYAQREQFAIRGVYTMDGSKRSAKLNAFFTGFGRFRKIVFFDTLLEKLDDDEILAVLAHEMGHFKKHHIWKMVAAMIIQTGIMFFLLSLFLKNENLFAAFQMEELSIYASLVFFAFIYAPLNTFTAILQNHRSRCYEFEADRYGAETTGMPDTLIRGLKKLSRENLANLTPHPMLVFISYSHPPVLERIKALQELKV